MVLADIERDARAYANAEGSGAHDHETIRRWINQAQRIIVRQTGCLIADVGSTDLSITTVNGAVAASATIPTNADPKHFRPGDRIDIYAITGSSPNEVYTAEATNAQVLPGSTTDGVDLYADELKVSAAVTVSDGSYIFFRNDLGLIDTVADEPIYNLPWSCLQVLSVSLKYNSNDRFRELRRGSLKRLVSQHGIRWAELDGDVASGWPDSWMAYGKRQIKLHPAPATAVTHGLKIEYVRDPLPLIDSGDEPLFDESFHPGLAHFAAWMMLMRDENLIAAAGQREMFESYLGMAAEAMDYMPRAAMTRGTA